MFYRRIFISNKSTLPKNAKVIIAANHPNAFMDAFLIGVFTDKKMTTLVRSDVFSNKIISAILHLFGLIPVYRQQEGTHNLRKNEFTFRRSIKSLLKGYNILIFCEGTSIMGRTLQKIKKGTARLAFKTSESCNEPVYILPVALNYTHFTGFRKEVMLNIGNEIPVGEYFEEYKQNNAQGIQKLTHTIQTNLHQEIWSVDDSKHEALIEFILDLKRNEIEYPINKQIYINSDRFELEKNWVQKLNALLKNEELFMKFSTHKKILEIGLKKYKLHDLVWPETNNKSVLLSIIMSICMLPFYVFGSILYFTTFYLGKIVSFKVMKDPEFYTSVWLSLTMIFYLIYTLIILINFGVWITIFFLFFSMVASFTKFFSEELWSEVMYHLKIKTLKKKNIALFNQLLLARKELTDF